MFGLPQVRQKGSVMGFYSGIYKVFAAPVRWLYRVRVTDGEKMPESGGCIVCANHTSLRDVFVLAASMHRQPRYMAKKELFRIPVLSQLIRALGAFPVDRGSADVGALKKAMAMIKGGEAVTIFPQGTRHPGVDPRTTEPKNGVGMIAYHTKAPVVPVYIKTKKRHVLPFRRTEIICGDPISYEELGFESGGREEYARASAVIFEKICELSDATHADGEK